MTTAEIKEAGIQRLVGELDGRRLGRFGFNKCTTGARPVLTVYDVENCGDATDQQLTFTPLELVGFCREVLRINAAVSGRKVQKGGTT